MEHSDAKAVQLLTLFRDKVRPFLEGQKVHGLDALDRQAELVDQALARPQHVNIGFVGEAQVGKSTLINAVLGRTALPSGGTGPLTARATTVSWAADDTMRVVYHGKVELNRLRFAIEQYLQRRGDLPAWAAPVQNESDEELDETGDESEEHTNIPAHVREKGEYMVAQARRLIGLADGMDESANLIALDGIRAVMGHSPITNAQSLEPHLGRIKEICDRLGTQEHISRKSAGDAAAFNRELKLRAAGWLSPLVAELDLGLAAPNLEGLSLVDLPGVGNVGDPAARAALEFVETNGHALVIVFRNNGVGEVIAELLEKSGVITRLLFGGRGAIAPIHLIVAVTHLDDVTRTRYVAAAQEAQAAGDPLPDRHDLFRQISAEMEATLRDQIGGALRRSRSFEDLDGNFRASREAAVTRLCETMDIICVAAPDYLANITTPGLGISFLTDPIVTGIPRFRDSLIELSRTSASRRQADVSLHSRQLASALYDHLSALRQRYVGGAGGATVESERFRTELEKHLGPLRMEMAGLHGEVMGTLRRGLLESIKNLCGDAQAQGMKKLSRLTRHGRENLHYQSLKAALTRGGVWEGRNIDYPDSLTSALLDAIAAEWEPKVVEGVRSEIRKMADRDLKLVERLVEVATELDARIVAESSIEAQKRILLQNSRTAVAWTKEQLEELRDTIQKKLRAAIELPIAKACKKAILAGRHVNSGAKERILQTFEEGGGEAVEEARKAAEQLLKANYNSLLGGLEEGFLKEHHDPVQAAFDALTDETAGRAKRSDAQKRGRVLSEVERLSEEVTAVLESLPVEVAV